MRPLPCLPFLIDEHVLTKPPCQNSSVTGPSHDDLGLSFTAEAETVSVEPLPIHPTEAQKLDADGVCKWVMAGLRQVNQEPGTQYRLGRIQFVISDSPPTEMYATLARCIVGRLNGSPRAFNGTQWHDRVGSSTAD